MHSDRLEKHLIQKCQDHNIHDADIHKDVEQGLQLFYPMPTYPAPPTPRDPQSSITVDSFILRFKK